SQAAHPALRCERGLERNQPSQRVADDMSRVPANVVHQSQRVGSELWDGERYPGRLAGAYSAIIKGETSVIALQDLDLRIRRGAPCADTLNHDQRRTVSGDPVGHRTALEVEGLKSAIQVFSVCIPDRE